MAYAAPPPRQARCRKSKGFWYRPPVPSRCPAVGLGGTFGAGASGLGPEGQLSSGVGSARAETMILRDSPQHSLESSVWSLGDTANCPAISDNCRLHARF